MTSTTHLSVVCLPATLAARGAEDLAALDRPGAGELLAHRDEVAA